jgi:hypothetical protein
MGPSLDNTSSSYGFFCLGLQRYIAASTFLLHAYPMTLDASCPNNLCSKLGLIHDEDEPMESALQEFITIFNDPLIVDTITTLTRMRARSTSASPAIRPR